MMLEQCVRAEHHETEDRGADHEQVEDIEDPVDGIGEVVEEIWHVALHFLVSEARSDSIMTGWY